MPFDETAFGEHKGLRLAQTLRAAGLPVRPVSAHADLGRNDSVDKLRRRLDFATALGARILISNATTADQAQVLAGVMVVIQPDLAARDLVLALENPGHGAGALLPDGARAAAVIGALDDPQIRMNYGIGNATGYGDRGGTAADNLAAAPPVTARLPLKDLQAIGADCRFCLVGRGGIGCGSRVPHVSRPPGLPLGLEHPICLWRPG